MENEKTGFLSKINWTQIISALAIVFTFVGVDLTPELQANIVATIAAVQGALTVILRTWFTNSRITGFFS